MRDLHPKYSSSIELAGSKVYYRIEDRWVNFHISHIQVIGEFSAPPGMMAADYYFSIILRESGAPIDIPADCDGLFEALAGLKKLLPGIGNPKLQMETDFNSNVLYPAHVAGQPLYTFHSQSTPKFDFPLMRGIGGKKFVVTKDIRADVLEAVY
jgi:hypothetical protein